MNNQVVYKCIFCCEKVDKNGRIQFNEQGTVIGCCGNCFKLCELFTKRGKKFKFKEV